MEKTTITHEELSLYFRSKRDLYFHLRFERNGSSDLSSKEGLYLPNYKECNLHFMHALIQGKEGLKFIS